MYTFIGIGTILTVINFDKSKLLKSCLKAELELRSLHQKMDLLLQEEFKTLFETQVRQMELLDDFLDKLKTRMLLLKDDGLVLAAVRLD